MGFLLDMLGDMAKSSLKNADRLGKKYGSRMTEEQRERFETRRSSLARFSEGVDRLSEAQRRKNGGR